MMNESQIDDFNALMQILLHPKRFSGTIKEISFGTVRNTTTNKLEQRVMIELTGKIRKHDGDWVKLGKTFIYIYSDGCTIKLLDPALDKKLLKHKYSASFLLDSTVDDLNK